MDGDITSLAADAGTTLVTLMVTDAWERIRERIAGLWHRVQPTGAEPAVRALELDREDLMATRGDDIHEAAEELRIRWRGRIRRLLAAHPEAAGELRSLLDEFTAPQQAQIPSAQHATASGHARIYQAGRDQHITRR